MAFELFNVVGRLALDGHDEVVSGLNEIDQGAEQTQNGFDQLADGIESSGQRISSAGDTLSKTVTGPLAAVGAAATGLVSNFAGAADEVEKTSQMLGISGERYQEIEYALGQIAGMGAPEAQRSLERLNQTVAEAQQGSDSATQALQDLGFSQQEIADGAIDTEEAFNRAIQQIENAGSQSEATGAAMELFGRRTGRQLAPALRESEQAFNDVAESIPHVFTEEQREAAAAFNDQWDDTTRTLQGVGYEVAEALLPIIESFTEWLEQDGAEALERFADRIIGLVEGFRSLPGPVQSAVVKFTLFAGALGPVLSIVGRVLGPVGRLVRLLGNLRGATVAATVAKAALAAPFVKFLAIGAAVAAAVYGVYRALQQISAVSEAVGSAMTGLGERISDTGSVIRSWGGTVGSVFSEAGSVIQGWAQSAISAVQGWAQSAMSAVSELGFAGAIRAAFSAALDAKREWAQQGLEVITGWVTSALEAVGAFTLARAIGNAVNQALTVLREWAGNAAGVIADWVGLVPSIIAGGASAVGGAMQNMVSGAWDVLRGWADNVMELFRTMPRMVVQAIGNMAQAVVEQFINMARGAINAVQNMFSAIVGNSILPELRDRAGEEMAGMAEDSMGSAADMERGVQGHLDEIDGPSGRSNGAGPGGGQNIDMRHAVIRDDRDMLDRMRRQGVDISGAAA